LQTMKGGKGHPRGQVSLEAGVVVSIALITLGVIIMETISRNNDAQLLGESYRRFVICSRIASSASEAYSLGPYSTVNMTLPAAENVTIYGTIGLVSVGGDSGVNCNMPSGMVNRTVDLKKTGFITFKNLGGWVEVKGG